MKKSLLPILTGLLIIGCGEEPVNTVNPEHTPSSGNEAECTHGESTCKGDVIKICVNGKWKESTCSQGCDESAGACNKVDVSGECDNDRIICQDDVLSTCINKAWTHVDCKYGCKDQVSCNTKPAQGNDPVTPEPETCEEGKTTCEGGIQKKCHGGLWEKTTCTNGCDGDKCAESQQPPVDNPPVDNPPVEQCTNGTVTCEGNVLKTCISGDWKTENCPNGCLNNQCAKCKTDDTKCENNVESICQNGDWQKKLDCQYGCNESGKSCDSINQMQPTRYLMKSLHSPITPYVVEQMKKIAAKNPNASNNVFIKVGDSHYNYSFDGCFMKCFSKNTSSAVTLDKYTNLQTVIDTFQKSKDSFNRDSISAVGGSTARDMNKGANSKIYQEIAAMNPRFAFYDHGTNDTGNGSFIYGSKSGEYDGYAKALEDYYRQMNRAIDQLVSKGVIPLITGVSPIFTTPTNINYVGSTIVTNKMDYPRYIVGIFNAVSRGIAEARQLPWYDVYHDFYPRPDHGLRSDHIHGSTKGSPCNFAADGLNYGVNVRNLGSIQMLQKAWDTVVNGAEATDPIDEPFRGTGSPSDPFLITSIPFTHTGDTSKSPNKILSTYGGTCKSGNGYTESGAEYYYKLELKQKTRLKIFAVSGRKYNDSGVVATYDMDIHILKDKPEASACMVRADILTMGYLEAGTYYLVVDTYGENATDPKPGDYLLGVVECDNVKSSGESAWDYDYDKRCDEPLKSY